MSDSAILLIHCPDQKGIVAAVSGFLYRHGANILHADQHRDNELALFFMRVEWTLADFVLDEETFRRNFQEVADRFGMHWKIAYSSVRPNVAIFLSRYEHCLLDLLDRYGNGELRCRIPLIISNHESAARLAHFYGITFHHVPVTPGNKQEAERIQLALLQEHAIELVILARYMQVLSPEFVARHPERMINVHHSFLPAFSGARPYQAAHHRGVKLIGATSHYVTEALDEGPIIEQDVLRVSHRDQIEDLIQKGRDLERVVLSRAVQWHLNHRLLQYAGKTVVFD
jgi:formyltetrahydrofolate deformylase